LRFEHVVHVRTRLVLKGASPTTVNLTLTALRQTARAAKQLGQLSSEDAQAIWEVPGVRSERLPRGRMLQPKEKDALFAACERDESPAGRRDACLIALMLSAGLRREECAQLNLAGVDLPGQQLRLIGKGGREATVRLIGEASDAIADWICVRGAKPGALLLPISWTGRVRCGRLSGQDVYRIVVRRAAEAGIPHCTPHDLRRTFISELLDLSNDQTTVQELARHKNLSTTARYNRRGERAKVETISGLRILYKRPRPKRTPRKAKRGKRRRRRYTT
jgi:site-specific recombinase XerC